MIKLIIVLLVTLATTNGELCNLFSINSDVHAEIGIQCGIKNYMYCTELGLSALVYGLTDVYCLNSGVVSMCLKARIH